MTEKRELGEVFMNLNLNDLEEIDGIKIAINYDGWYGFCRLVFLRHLLNNRLRKIHNSLCTNTSRGM